MSPQGQRQGTLPRSQVTPAASPPKVAAGGIGGAGQGAPRLRHLEHGGDVRVLGLHQLPPGGEVAVGKDAPRLQQAEGMVLAGGGGGQWSGGGGGGQRRSQRASRQVRGMAEGEVPPVWTASTPTGLTPTLGLADPVPPHAILPE